MLVVWGGRTKHRTNLLEEYKTQTTRIKASRMSKSPRIFLFSSSASLMSLWFFFYFYLRTTWYISSYTSTSFIFVIFFSLQVFSPSVLLLVHRHNNPFNTIPLPTDEDTYTGLTVLLLLFVSLCSVGYSTCQFFERRSSSFVRPSQWLYHY